MNGYKHHYEHTLSTWSNIISIRSLFLLVNIDIFHVDISLELIRYHGNVQIIGKQRSFVGLASTTLELHTLATRVTNENISTAIILFKKPFSICCFFSQINIISNVSKYRLDLEKILFRKKNDWRWLIVEVKIQLNHRFYPMHSLLVLLWLFFFSFFFYQRTIFHSPFIVRRVNENEKCVFFCFSRIACQTRCTEYSDDEWDHMH